MSNAPLIGICTDHVRHFPAPDRDRSYLKLYPEYPQAIARAGGIPLLIPIMPGIEHARPLLQLVRGVVMIGSDDYPPDWYGAKPHPREEYVTPQRAAFDRAFVDHLYNHTSLPVLAICGGMQLMTIFSGGKLVQHIEPTTVQHRQDGGIPTRHEVSIEAGTALAKALGVTRAETYSLHHQGAAAVGPRLRVCARADDGLIEAVEFTDHPFRVGVQWHPERQPESEVMQRLFRAFIQAAQQ